MADKYRDFFHFYLHESFFYIFVAVQIVTHAERVQEIKEI